MTWTDDDAREERQEIERYREGRDYPDPEPAHPRDTPDRSALHPKDGPGHRLVDDLEQRLQVARAARRAAEEELEGARKLIGSGPFVIVKLQSLNAITDSGEAEVRVAFGGGVTRHVLGSVLSLGMQAVQESLPPADPTRGQVRAMVSGEQDATVRLPEPGQRLHATWPVPGDLRRTPEGELQEWDGRNWWSVGEPPQEPPNVCTVPGCTVKH